MNLQCRKEMTKGEHSANQGKFNKFIKKIYICSISLELTESPRYCFC